MLNMWQISISTFSNAYWIIEFSVRHKNNKKQALEWNKLDPSFWNSASYNVFENSILKFVRPAPKKIFQYHNPKGIKLVARYSGSSLKL